MQWKMRKVLSDQQAGMPTFGLKRNRSFGMNLAMWNRALKAIPNVSLEEWDDLDFVSKWLISTRAAVLIMTFISALLAGLFAARDGAFQFVPWLALAFGLIMAHASNNLLNDHVDYLRGVDQGNYYRTMYGPQPLSHGLMTKRHHLVYFVITGFLGLAAGLYLIWYNNFDLVTWIVFALGAFFLLFYTWPLKHLALGELAVLIVWGPLMIGGGYYTLTHHWDWNVVWAGSIYALGVTTVIFGKHIDKVTTDREKNIHTLPVLIGEKMARHIVIAMMILPYLLLVHLVTSRYFTPFILIALLAIPRLRRVLPAFHNPKPATRPRDFPEGQGGWPLYFAPLAFWYNRSFGTLFVAGLLADVLIRILAPAFWY
jgi:1,4-dihydroxy-2-naphthoate octaprenyltransferase